jgi:peptidoglycan hydrolase CwlO-like protein
MDKLTPDQLKTLAQAVSNQGPTLEQISLLVGVILSVLLIGGVLISVVRFIAKVGALSQRMNDKIEKNEADITGAHNKIRAIEPRVGELESKTEVLDERINSTNTRIEDLRRAAI